MMPEMKPQSCFAAEKGNQGQPDQARHAKKSPGLCDETKRVYYCIGIIDAGSFHFLSF